MTAAPGVATTAQPPNTVVQIQPGMNVQAVTLVDQNGQYVSMSGRYLCAPAQYAPASAVTIQTASATYASASATATTVASGSNGGEISTIASWSAPSSGVLDVASTAGWPTAGTISVATSTTPATVTYTGVTSASLTGCAYVSGSATGTVATGGAVALTAAGAGAVAVPALSTGSFTAPASGFVVVTVIAAVASPTASAPCGLALAAHGTVTPLLGAAVGFTLPNTVEKAPRPFQFLVPVTPGSTYNLDLLMAASNASDPLDIVALGSTSTTNSAAGGPVIMTVQAV